MKLSVSLPESDVEVLDAYAKHLGLSSRSAAVHRAVRLLAMPDLDEDYAAAWEEWESSGEQAAWDSTSADGV